MGGMVVVATRTRVHAGNEHKRSRIGHRVLGSGNGNLTVFKRLAKHLQYRLRELGQLVEIEHTIVGKTDLSRHRVGTTANEGDTRNSMVRGAEGTLGDQTRRSTKSRHRMYLGGFESFAERKRRKNRRQALRHHRLARARRSHHNHVMSSGCSDGKGTLHHLLSLDVLEVVGIGALSLLEHLARIHLQALHLRFSSHKSHDILERVGTKHIEVVDHGSLAGVFTRNDDALEMHLTCQDGKGKTTFDGLHGPVERQFAHHHVLFKLVGRNLPVGSHHSHGDGHIVERTLLTHISRGKIDGDGTSRKTHTGFAQSAFYTITALLDSRIRQANQNGSYALCGHRLAIDGGGIDTLQGCRNSSNDHDSELFWVYV